MEDDKLAEKLASGEYSISPRSGRLRKRIRLEENKKKKKKKSPVYSKRKANKFLVKLVWILMIIAFIISVAILLPEITQTNSKNKNGSQLPLR